MNLFEINQQLESFQFVEDEATGEILNIDELDQLQMQRDEKIENIALFIKNLKAEEKAFDDEIKNMQNRKAAVKKKAESLTNYLYRNLNGQKFSTSKTSISYRKSSKVDIYDEEIFEKWAKANKPELLTITETIKPDKKAIMADLKNGEQIEGARIETNSNISIK